MFALLLAPFAAFWSVDNSDYLKKLTGAEWEYVGYQQRQPGLQKDGAMALTMDVDGTSFILFKQRSVPVESKSWDLAENVN